MKSTNHYLYLILICTYLIFAVSTKMYAQNLDWATTFSSGSYKFMHKVTEDRHGNIIVAGKIGNNCTIVGPNTNTTIQGNSVSSIFFAKMEPNGQLIWANTLDGDSFGGAATGVAIDSDDNIYLTGNFYGTVDFDPGPDSEIHSSNTETETPNTWLHNDVFIAKYNPDGEFIWVKILSGDGPNYAHDIDISESDSLIYISGDYSSTLDFNPSELDSNIYSPISDYKDAFIACYTTNGDFRWAKGIGAPYPSASETRELCALADGSVVAATITAHGLFHIYPDSIETNDFPDGSLVLTKISDDGEILWNRVIGGSGTNQIRDIKKGVGNDFCISGNLQTEIDLWPENSDVGNYSSEGIVTAFVARFDYDGNYLNSAAFGNGEYGTFGDAIAINSASEIYVASRFHGMVDLNPGEANAWHTSSPKSSPYILKLDEEMNYQWSQQLNGVFYLNGYSNVFLSSNTDLVISGFHSSSLDLDPGPAYHWIESFGESDHFVVRHKCSGESEVEITGCNEYELPFSQNIVTESGTYTEVMAFDGNCTHTSVIDVEILDLNNEVVTQNDSLYSLENNAQYHWFDCDNPEMMLPNSDEQYFLPAESGMYAVDVSNDFCTVTSSCISFNPTNVVERMAKSFNCWPNPTNSFLYFETIFSVPKIYSLYTIHGSLLISGKTEQGINKLDINHLQPGVYILNIEGFSEKVVKY